jgi:hemolysin activation/secretion protein
MSKKLVFFLFFIITGSQLAFSAPQPEQIERSEQEIDKEQELRKAIEAPKVPTPIEEKLPPETSPKFPEVKTFITKIDVTGVTLLSQANIDSIIRDYQNKELKMAEMQKVADLITDAYRTKGFVTSRAYLPPQKIENNILKIIVIEGITGDITVKGNRFFKASLLREKIELQKGQPFNYEYLRKGLSRINALPDRNVKAILTPGKEAGMTDVILEVKDDLPIHFGLNWDNYGSRYIDRYRYKASLTHNNLLGFDDVFVFQYQISESDRYRLYAFRYLFPLTQDLKIGFFAARSNIELGREFKDLQARGKSRFYTLFLTQSFIDAENLSFSMDFAFDYKDTFNFQNTLITSRDRLRNLRWGIDADFTDIFGRTFITNEFTYGIPGIMGGSQSVDTFSTRSGAGGKFYKDTVNLIRLQKMPFDSRLLWKNQLQFSPYTLTATEQFQIGGIANVRGYPPAEAVGDKGYTMTWEWSFPIYFIPKASKVPFSKTSLYDAFRFVGFYDWANTRLRRPATGESKNKTLRSAGWGLRFKIAEDVSLRYDIAWPLDGTPSDGKHAHQWMEVSKSF